ncbi:MAG: aldo/keto reductase [Bacteroidota bacterium]|nr:aldo/keto reductase [Bacteroidota bacterium]
MKYKLLGHTGLKVSELTLGAMTFGGKGYWTAIGTLGQQTVDEIIAKCVEAGVNFIDTANVYSEGVSEEMTGKAIRNLGLKREGLVIATKVRGKMSEDPNGIGLSRKHILHQIDESLRRLQTDYVDLYQIHGFDSHTPLEETLDTLDQLVKSGKVRYVGCSNLAAWQIMKALGYSERYHLQKFVSLQAFYTLASRDLEREIIPMLHDQKMGLMVWSPLAGGLLTGKFTREGQGDKDARRTHFDFPPVHRERLFNVLEVLREIADEKKVSVTQLALAWLLHQKAVTTVIIGVKNMKQLEENLRSVEVEFTPDELTRLDEVSKLDPEYPGWMIARMAVDRSKH